MKISYIEKLLDRYFDGTTSIDEEHTLYRFFQQDNVPESLHVYQQMFRDMAAALPSSATEKPSRGKRRTLALRIAAGVAATVAIGFFAVAFHNARKEHLAAAVYEGSYMIVNGQRIDDYSQIKKAIHTTLNEATSIERDVEQMQTVDEAEREVLQSIDEPEERRDIEQLLNE